MGFGGISIWQLLIVLAIIVLLFGTKKLRNIGGDLGSAVKSFKGAVREGEQDAGKEADENLEADPEPLDKSGTAQSRQATEQAKAKHADDKD